MVVNEREVSKNRDEWTVNWEQNSLDYILWVARLFSRSGIFGFAVAETAQHICDHVHFFEIHQISKIRLIALVCKSQVLEQKRYERYNWRVHFGD